MTTPRRMRPIASPGGGVDVLVTPAPRPAPVDRPVDRAELKSLKALDINAFNATAEDAFMRVVTALIREEGAQLVRVVLAEAAYELDISTETAKRYLLKHSARRAALAVVAGRVCLREDAP